MSLPHSCANHNDAEGFVLAGGGSTRMGSDKALIQFAGAPLIKHAISILHESGLKTSIAGGRSDVSTFAPVVPDDPAHSNLGPLAGICSALNETNSRYAVFLPVDLPLIPPSLIYCLLHRAIITQSAITIVSVAGFVQTFPAVIDRDAVSSLQASLQSNDRKALTAFRAAANALVRPFSTVSVELLAQAGQVSHLAGIPPHSWFLNINSPGDLARAEAQLSTSNQVI